MGNIKDRPCKMCLFAARAVRKWPWGAHVHKYSPGGGRFYIIYFYMALGGTLPWGALPWGASFLCICPGGHFTLGGTALWGELPL